MVQVLVKPGLENLGHYFQIYSKLFVYVYAKHAHLCVCVCVCVCVYFPWRKYLESKHHHHQYINRSFLYLSICLFMYWWWCLVSKLCLIFHDPMDHIACQAPLSMGFSRQEYWSGLPFPSPVDLNDPGIKHAFLYWQVDYLWATGKPIYIFISKELLPSSALQIHWK